jgi:hypothetical protein
VRQGRGEGGEDAMLRCRVGEGPDPTGGERPRQRKAGSLMGGPTLQWRVDDRETDADAWAPQHSTTAVKFDSKNKFQFRLKSNGSNEFRIHPNFD